MNIESMYPISASPQRPRKEKFQLQCTHCPFKAQYKRAFIQHNTCHNRNPAAKYQCPQCSYSVDNPWHLNCHLKLHSGEILEDNINNIGDQQVRILLLYSAKNSSFNILCKFSIFLIFQKAEIDGGNSKTLSKHNDTQFESKMISTRHEQGTFISPTMNENTVDQSSTNQVGSILFPSIAFNINGLFFTFKYLLPSFFHFYLVKFSRFEEKRAVELSLQPQEEVHLWGL